MSGSAKKWTEAVHADGPFGSRETALWFVGLDRLIPELHALGAPVLQALPLVKKTQQNRQTTHTPRAAPAPRPPILPFTHTQRFWESARPCASTELGLKLQR